MLVCANVLSGTLGEGVRGIMIRWVSAIDYEQRLARSHWVGVLFAFVCALLPMLFYLPQVYVFLFALALVVKWFALRQYGQRLALWLLLGFVPLALWLIYLHFPSEGTTYSFLALLATMSGAKLLEARNQRDVRVMFMLNALLVLAFLMYSTMFLIFLYAVFALGVNVWVLMKVEHRDSRLVSLGRWRDMVKLLLVSVPFTLLLFFFFPRIEPLWSLPRHSNQAITGLPEEMGMGDISGLAQSNEVAFRVRFADGQIPASDKLYWRGPVLWLFDGKNWRQWQEDFRQEAMPIRYRDDSVIDYELMPVKRDLKWLLALDLPIDFPEDMRLGRAYQLRLPEASLGSQRYALRSATVYEAQGLSAQERAAALQLPSELSIPKTEALARELWQANGRTSEGFIQGFLNHLHNEAFYYSLEPPPGAGDVERFLFAGGRIGFCEHYSNAMVLAARSVGIPARVVLGYQGGELNPLNGDWLVREEAAHAWVEVWLDKVGWQRVDPTAAVAPERILQARLSADALTAGSDARALGSRVAEALGAYAWARHAVAYTQALWQDWVIDLDRNKQQSLFGRLGLADLGALGVVVSLMLLVLLLSIALFLWWQAHLKREPDALKRELQRLLRRLEKQGHHKHTHESLTLFLRRIAPQLAPASQSSALEAAQLYEQVRYWESVDSKHLLATVKAFRKKLFMR